MISWLRKICVVDYQITGTGWVVVMRCSPIYFEIFNDACSVLDDQIRHDMLKKSVEGVFVALRRGENRVLVHLTNASPAAVSSFKDACGKKIEQHKCHIIIRAFKPAMGFFAILMSRTEVPQL